MHNISRSIDVFEEFDFASTHEPLYFENTTWTERSGKEGGQHEGQVTIGEVVWC